MSWFFEHKLFSLLLIAAIFYWVKSPADLFGFSHQGLVIYNRIPVFQADCYISPKGKLHYEADLSKKENITSWIDNHVSTDPGASSTFLVGTGFSGQQINFTPEQLGNLKQQNMNPVILSSETAIVRFTELRKEGKQVSILLKVK